MLSLLVAAALAAAPQQKPRPLPSTAPPASPVEPRPADVDLSAATLLARACAGEPPLEAVQDAAARHALRAVTPDATRRRIRAAALLPKVALELQRDDRRYHVVGLTSTSEVDYVRHTPGNQLSVRLSWDLGAAVFSDAELRIAEKEASAAKARADAVERATRLYFERRRLLLALATAPAATPRERAEREVELEELGGVLDAMTGGLWQPGGSR